VVRGGVAKGPPAPWPSLVLDSEGLWSVSRSESNAQAAVQASWNAGVRVVVPSIVLAETLFGDQRDAPVNQVLKKLAIFSVDEDVARVAARLKRLSGMSGVASTVDAIVVAVSVSLGGGAILTSDPDDIKQLADAQLLPIHPIVI
jgi:predicted nucleic acid-binding protein